MRQQKIFFLSDARFSNRVRVRRGVARWLEPSILAFGVACAGAFGQGCGQSNDPGPSARTEDPNAIALSAIESCQTQARDCFASSDSAVCEDQLRDCLLARLPDAGTPPPHPEHDGAAPPPHPEHDGDPDDDDVDGGKPARDGAPPGPNPPHDGAPPDPPDPRSPDAGRPPLPDAAKGALTDPVGHDGGPDQLACVNALRACLATATRPSTCAEQSQQCLGGGRDGG
jgi:hypothetical protein